MSTKVVEGLGRIWLPEASISLPGKPVAPKHTGVVTMVQRRPKWSVLGVIPPLPEVLHPEQQYPGLHRVWDVTLQRWITFTPSEWAVREALAPYRDQIDPKLLRDYEIVVTSVTHNERVNKGGDISVSALFGTVGTTPNGVFSALAIATSGLASTAAAHLSIGSNSANVSTNEFTTIGLSRTTATIQNYVAASSLNGTYAVDAFKSFSVTGGGTAHGAAIFDSTTVSGSHLYAEDIFSSDAVCVNGDTLQVTYTVNN